MKEIVFAVLAVKRKAYITPHYISVTLTGSYAQLKPFEKATTGGNNKIFIPPSGENSMDWSAFAKGAPTAPIEADKVVQPIVRTYTHRKLDMENLEMVIEFVAHGDEGLANKWAQNAQMGDQLGVAVKIRDRPIFPEALHYILVGDATSIPVISVILESLPDHANADVLLEVPAREDEQIIRSKADVTIKWFYNENPQQGSELANALRQITLPKTGSSRFAFIAGEQKTVEEIKTFLKSEHKWTSDEVNAYAYWKAGQTGDRSKH